MDLMNGSHFLNFQISHIRLAKWDQFNLIYFLEKKSHWSLLKIILHSARFSMKNDHTIDFFFVSKHFYTCQNSVLPFFFQLENLKDSQYGLDHPSAMANQVLSWREFPALLQGSAKMGQDSWWWKAILPLASMTATASPRSEPLKFPLFLQPPYPRVGHIFRHSRKLQPRRRRTWSCGKQWLGIPSIINSRRTCQKPHGLLHPFKKSFFFYFFTFSSCTHPDLIRVMEIIQLRVHLVLYLSGTFHYFGVIHHG